MQAQHLLDLVADGEHGIEARHRLLEDHADAVAAQRAHGRRRQGQEIAAFEQDAPAEHPRRRARQQPHDGHGGDALAAAGFADQPQGSPGADREARLLDDRRARRLRIEGDRQVVDGEERGVWQGQKKKALDGKQQKRGGNC